MPEKSISANRLPARARARGDDLEMDVPRANASPLVRDRFVRRRAVFARIVGALVRRESQPTGGDVLHSSPVERDDMSSLSDARARMIAEAMRRAPDGACELHEFPAESRSSSILLDAVGIGRVAAKHGSASAAFVLVVYETSEAMVRGVKEYLERVSADVNAEVIACATEEKDHKELVAMEEQTNARFACFWNSKRAQEPRDAASMYKSIFLKKHIDGRCNCPRAQGGKCLPGWIKGAPLAPVTWPKNEPRKCVLVLCFSMETLENGITKSLMEKVLTDSKRGLKVSCAVMQGRLKRDGFAKMKISTIFFWSPTNLDLQRRDDDELSRAVKRRRITNTGVAHRRAFLSYRRDLTPEQRAQREERRRAEESHLRIIEEAVMLNRDFRCLADGRLNRLKKHFRKWRDEQKKPPDLDEDDVEERQQSMVRQWLEECSAEDELKQDVRYLCENQITWLRYLHWAQTCRLSGSTREEYPIDDLMEVTRLAWSEFGGVFLGIVLATAEKVLVSAPPFLRVMDDTQFLEAVKPVEDMRDVAKTKKWRFDKVGLSKCVKEEV